MVDHSLRSLKVLDLHCRLLCADKFSVFILNKLKVQHSKTGLGSNNAFQWQNKDPKMRNIFWGDVEKKLGNYNKDWSSLKLEIK